MALSDLTATYDGQPHGATVGVTPASVPFSVTYNGNAAAPVNAGSFYLNGRNGDYETYVARDVWGFVKANYCVRPERGAHVIRSPINRGQGMETECASSRPRRACRVRYAPWSARSGSEG